MSETFSTLPPHIARPAQRHSDHPNIEAMTPHQRLALAKSLISTMGVDHLEILGDLIAAHVRAHDEEGA